MIIWHDLELFSRIGNKKAAPQKQRNGGITSVRMANPAVVACNFRPELASISFETFALFTHEYVSSQSNVCMYVGYVQHQFAASLVIYCVA